MCADSNTVSHSLKRLIPFLKEITHANAARNSFYNVLGCRRAYVDDVGFA
jgi:hypothetical protein